MPPPPIDSRSYLKAYEDVEFLAREELRPLRLHLELLKAEMVQQEQNIHSTIVVFGGTRIVEPGAAGDELAVAEKQAAASPQDAGAAAALRRARRMVDNSRYYDEARAFARLVSSNCQFQTRCENVIVTGGGPGIMEAANRGAHDVGAKSIGLSIVLPFETEPNAFITPDLCFQFKYFAIRKMHFLMRAKAMVVFPGGFGTMDELFETLTLIQTRKMPQVPVLLFGRSFWKEVIDFDALVEHGTIRASDLDLFSFVETAREAWDTISAFHDEVQVQMPEF
ncbi:MAG: LOG family protein [Acidobacteriota bacterium]